MAATDTLNARRSDSEGRVAAVERLSAGLSLMLVTQGALALGQERLMQTACLATGYGSAHQ